MIENRSAVARNDEVGEDKTTEGMHNKVLRADVIPLIVGLNKSTGDKIHRTVQTKSQFYCMIILKVEKKGKNVKHISHQLQEKNQNHVINITCTKH